jgi:hypothetical protein
MAAVDWKEKCRKIDGVITQIDVLQCRSAHEHRVRAGRGRRGSKVMSNPPPLR